MVNRSFPFMTTWSEMHLEERDEQIANLLVMPQGNEHKHRKPRRVVFDEKRGKKKKKKEKK